MNLVFGCCSQGKARDGKRLSAACAREWGSCSVLALMYNVDSPTGCTPFSGDCGAEGQVPRYVRKTRLSPDD